MKHLVMIVAMVAIICGSAHSSNLNDYLDFYVGADSQLRVTKFKNGFGNNLLKKAHAQGNIYLGFMLSDNIGVEAGYESTAERWCDSTLGTGHCCAGRYIPGILNPAVFKTKLRIKGPHIGLILFHPLENSPISFLGSIGISSIKGTAEIKGISLGHPAIPGTIRTLSKHKEAVRLMGGAQYLMKSGLGFRGSMSFIRTRKIVIKKSDEHPSIHIPIIKLRDSMVYGLGVFWVF